ncbi:RNA-binding domain-containing protein [Phanerochaete sordida]|uniref:Probable RNA-binding protein 18 n=1 Tax=Phanerochaete sordida TaxID=48140 RepID=A0A9P3GMS7_9APHY|nr:RNA-binding domain-containing protein [Phanerochaete sordida]
MDGHVADEAQSDNLLSYPVASTSKDTTPPPPPQARQLLKDRLYVGNLAPTVDEYTLLQVFSKYGKIAKLDFLFHKAGPLKGKPRGYAFVEYADEHDAARALAAAHDKLLRGRKLVVTHAQQAPLDPLTGSQLRARRHAGDAGRPTTLSLIKSANAGRAEASTQDKIAKMEAKLRQMEGAASAVPAPPPHPSLPPKPVGAALAATLASHDAVQRVNAKRASPLPTLPLAQPPPAGPRIPPALPAKPAHGGLAPPARKATPALAGVKMKKHKETS